MCVFDKDAIRQVVDQRAEEIAILCEHLFRLLALGNVEPVGADSSGLGHEVDGLVVEAAGNVDLAAGQTRPVRHASATACQSASQG